MKMSQILQKSKQIKDSYREKISDETLDFLESVAFTDFCFSVRSDVLEQFDYQSPSEGQIWSKIYNEILDLFYEEIHKLLKPILDKYEDRFSKNLLLSLRDVSIFDTYDEDHKYKSVKNGIELVKLMKCYYALFGEYVDDEISIDTAKMMFEIYTEFVTVLKQNDC